jgi:hypothetical protein
MEVSLAEEALGTLVVESTLELPIRLVSRKLVSLRGVRGGLVLVQMMCASISLLDLLLQAMRETPITTSRNLKKLRMLKKKRMMPKEKRMPTKKRRRRRKTPTTPRSLANARANSTRATLASPAMNVVANTSSASDPIPTGLALVA